MSPGFSYTFCSVAEKAITSFTFIHALFLSWERRLWEDPHRGSYPLSIAASSVLLLRQFPGQDLERADHEEATFPQVGAGAKCSRLTSAEQGGSDKSTLIMERLRRMWFHKNEECLGSGQLQRSSVHASPEHLLSMKYAKMRRKEKDFL